MQMIEPTAKRTAERAHIPFDPKRLVSDAAFNARLAARHLGELLAEAKGSYVLAFAAYNAGGKRVKEWIDTYGDPRKPGVDPIDWIERIPISETRNYVQRVIENVTIYRLRFGESVQAPVDAILKTQAKL
jgi:soluble lytic murein transglycosylase